MDTSFARLVYQLLYWLPDVLVSLLAIGFSLYFIRKHFIPSILVITGSSMVLLNATAGTVFVQLVLTQMSNPVLFTIVSVIRALIGAVSFGLIVAAVYMDRKS